MNHQFRNAPTPENKSATNDTVAYFNFITLSLNLRFLISTSLCSRVFPVRFLFASCSLPVRFALGPHQNSEALGMAYSSAMPTSDTVAYFNCNTLSLFLRFFLSASLAPRPFPFASLRVATNILRH
jgi:hypothetical protein